MSRILLAAYFYPPRNIIGARRPHALAKYLGRLGHDVTVLTSVHNGRGPDGAASRLVRARDLLAMPYNPRRGTLDAVTGEAGADATWSPGFNVFNALFMPDVQLYSWVPFALAAARRLPRPDVVITTSPTESTHAIGLALRRAGVPWIADLRDGWRFEHPAEDYPLALQRRLDERLEGLVVRSADAVVTVSDPLAEDLTRRHGVPVQTITNGFDPDDEAVPAPPADRLTLVHTGGLGHERSVLPVLEALARIGAPAELMLAGARTAEEREAYADPRLAPFVRHVGFVERPVALGLQRAADILVLVTSGRRTGEATGKLFEYLASGRPILVLGDRSAAADIVLDAGAGWAVPAHDADAVEAVLRRVLAGERPDGSGGRERYGWPALSARYAEVIEAVAQSTRGGARNAVAAV